MKTEKQTFERSEVKKMMKKLNCDTEEEALRTWANWNYPSFWHIKRVGKTFVEMTTA